MTRPQTNPFWATDDVYTNPPQATDPNKIAPTAGEQKEGYRPTQKPPAQHLNFSLHNYGEWLDYYKDIDWLSFNFLPPELVVPISSYVELGFVAMGFRSNVRFADSLAANIARFVGGTEAAAAGDELVASEDGSRFQLVGAGQKIRSLTNRSIQYSTTATLWIAVGGDAVASKILTAPNAFSTWTARTDPAAAADRYQWAEDGTIIVACRSLGGFISSPDGITWTERTHPSANKDVTCITHDGSGLFVAGGSSIYLTSADGLTWVERVPGTAPGQVLGIVWNPVFNVFCACSDQGEIQTSTDGITWTDRESFGAGIDVRDMQVDPSGVMYAIIDSFGTHLIRSLDGGLTWEGQVLPGGVVTNMVHMDGQIWLLGGLIDTSFPLLGKSTRVSAGYDISFP